MVHMHDFSCDLCRSLAGAPLYAGIVAQLDSMLRTVVDYPAVDAEARNNDLQLYRRFFADKMTESQLKKEFARAYKGFDEVADWAKIQEWAKGNWTAFLPG